MKIKLFVLSFFLGISLSYANENHLIETQKNSFLQHAGLSILNMESEQNDFNDTSGSKSLNIPDDKSLLEKMKERRKKREKLRKKREERRKKIKERELKRKKDRERRRKRRLND